MPQRGAYLVLLRLNVRGWATALADGLTSPTFANKLKDKWNTFGGNFTELKEAINAGKGKKALLGDSGKIGSATGVAAFMTNAAAIIAAIAPIIQQIISWRKQKKAGSGGSGGSGGSPPYTAGINWVPIGIAAGLGLLLTQITSTK